MAREKEIPFVLPTVDDLFSDQDQRNDARREKVMDIPLELIDGFPDHPYQVRIDDKMRELVENVREHGVISPTLARQKGRDKIVPSLLSRPYRPFCPAAMKTHRDMRRLSCQQSAM